MRRFGASSTVATVAIVPTERGPPMAAKQTAKAKAEAEAKQATPASNGRADYVPPDPPLAEQAQKIRADKGYNGKLTPELLLALEPLLRVPIDPRYIETTPALSGKPYVSTGVRSVQVQADRMNEVLGTSHWRVLYHYADRGAICKAVVIVGNGLAFASLDEAGNLRPFTPAVDRTSALDAEILAVREGYGGHSRGNAGDLYKGSETNALKRVLARLGPGSDVYRLDYDDDVNLSNEPEHRPTAARPAAAAASDAKANPVPPEQVLEALLNEESPLKDKRGEVARGMAILGAPPSQRLSEIRDAKDAKHLDALLERVNVAIDAREAPSDEASNG